MKISGKIFIKPVRKAQSFFNSSNNSPKLSRQEIIFLRNSKIVKNLGLAQSNLNTSVQLLYFSTKHWILQKKTASTKIFILLGKIWYLSFNSTFQKRLLKHTKNLWKKLLIWEPITTKNLQKKERSSTLSIKRKMTRCK